MHDIENKTKQVYCALRISSVARYIIFTIVKFTQLCSKFPPTALLNFACDG